MFETSLVALASFVNLILAISIFFKRRELTIWGQFFSYATFGIGFWGISTIFLNIFTNMIWERILFSSALIALLFMTLFTFDYVKEKSKILILLSVSGTVILLLLIWFTKLIVVDVKKAENGGIDVDLGGLMFSFTIFVLFSICVLIINLTKGFKTAPPIKKQQIRYMIIGIILFISPAILTNLLLPILGIYNFNNLGVIFSIAFTGAVTIAIVKHRLFSIRTFMLKILRALLIGSILFSIVLFQRIIKDQFYELSAFAPEALILDLITAIIVAAFIQELVFWVEIKLGKVINSEVIMLEELVIQIDKQSSDVLDMNTLVGEIIPILERAFPKTDFHIVKLQNDQVIYISKEAREIDISYDMLQTIKDIFIVQEGKNNELQLNAQSIDIIARISNDTYLLVQSDSTRDIYSKTELDSLEEIVIKLRNIFVRVEIHEKTIEFTKELQKRVDDATSDLQKSNEDLQEALRKEKDLVDIFSHELRTPAGNARNAIQMIDMLIKKPDISKDDFVSKVGDYTHKAVENIQRLSGIITRMLNATKLDTNELHLNLIEVDAIDVVNDSFDGFEEKALKKGLKLNLIKPKTPLSAIADRDAIQQVVDNLVDNAIKYTDSGSVTLKLEEKEGMVIFRISDTGRGIPEDELPKLGRKFYRIDNYLQNEDGEDNSMKLLRPDGTGIGLYVVKGLIEMMNGEFKIESEGVGKGSTFTFSIPKYVEASASE